MKISCNIIEDLLPLYVDDMVSEDSRQLVEEHLKECTTCQKNAGRNEKGKTACGHGKGRILADAERKAREPLKKIRERSVKTNSCCSDGSRIGGWQPVESDITGTMTKKSYISWDDAEYQSEMEKYILRH